ncbi:M3 family metallopeptidase [Candidatus Synechococcus calcipolaris G9]|uniref:oligopeptidase A n=1 Tax=Candidatus Synechococcus calcipolaris G9 TaxID=1497997 RepID=A0ABT6EVD9_9SYNE|nr:M3 family metallopeptidase [Candidatus Synechococcus calcipolaris]MDG2989728.1 M3 family metallopeptidase [Candidatus Synechococcus calcipolaris G9]
MVAALSSIQTENPLLRGQGFPPFDDIKADHVEPAVTILLANLRQELEELEQRVQPTWEHLVEPLDHLGDRLSWIWGIVNHLTGVKNSPELRQAYEQVQPQVVEFYTELAQSQPLYYTFKALRDSPEFSGLTPAQQRIVIAAIRNAEHTGVSLTGAAKERFNQIQQRLAELGTQFSNHVLDATKAFRLKLTQADEIAGLPPSLLALAAQTARSDGEANATPETGPWHITLDFPSFGPFLQHSQRRDLRKQVYRAYISRAASGELDNLPILEQILALRREEAQLLGFETYADLSLDSKMASSVSAVETLLEDLRRVSYPAAKVELDQLQAFAQEHGETEPLQHWDMGYWAERQREALFAFNDEELRPYFPLPQVLEGLFGLVERLFGVQIVPGDGQAPVWHPDVRFFTIQDENHVTIAHFYLDPYSRPAEKRGGAWMDDCWGRAKVRQGTQWQTRLPVAYLICNQTPPVDDKPSLMTFGEVETLFHEFGHGLQHMLTQVDEAGAAGINNIEWDAVELPSQFMENWCYHRPTLFGMARHYQTGEPLPEHYYEKLLAARTYRSGSAMLRQLNFSLLDIELHYRYRPGSGETALDVRDRLAPLTTVLPPLKDDAFLCSFGHIFAGGYAAGYYSYKWAEVLSADAFAAFEEVGLDNDSGIAETGRRFRDTVLALGGSLPPMDVFKAFRGREPSTEPLLRHSGLLTAK